MKPTTIELDGVEISRSSVEMFLSKISFGSASGWGTLLEVLIFVEKCPFLVGAGDVRRRFRVDLKTARWTIQQLISLGLVRGSKSVVNRFQATERGRVVAQHHGHPTAWARVLKDDGS